VIPKTAPFKQVKKQAAATRAKFAGDKGAAGKAADSQGRQAPDDDRDAGLPNGKKQRSSSSGDARPTTNGSSSNGFSGPSSRHVLIATGDDDPNAQLELEARQARGDEDVDMTG
jgi:DNA polymerase epsilon subunit 4